MYRIGFPGWKLAARFGVPLKLRIDVFHDKEAQSYWTSSPDLKGLIVSGPTLDVVAEEVRLAALDLLDIELHGHVAQTSPELRFKDSALCVA